MRIYFVFIKKIYVNYTTIHQLYMYIYIYIYVIYFTCILDINLFPVELFFSFRLVKINRNSSDKKINFFY